MHKITKLAGIGNARLLLYGPAQLGGKGITKRNVDRIRVQADGHTYVKHTEIYARVLNTKLDNAMQALDQARVNGIA